MEESQLARPESWTWHLLGFVLPAVVIAGNWLGGDYVWAGTILALGIYPVLDWVLGEDHHRREARTSGRPFEAMLIAHGLIVIPLIYSLVRLGAESGLTWTTFGAGFSTGIAMGMCGIVVGHELGHKKPRSLPWWLGRFTLVSVLYAHFTTEHNYHHHKTVATRLDPASAPKGRGLWFHVAQTIPRQFISAWGIQAKKSKSFFHNEVVHGLILEIMLGGLIYAFFGLSGLWAFTVQAGVAIFLLEYVNYIRHYGLERAVDERQTEQHSWQSKKRLSRWALIELTLHPAHHLKASLPFWQLQPYEDAPELPTGYFGLFWPCLIPPLWKRWMAPRIPN